MANPAPTINQINAFNATQGTTIDFNIIGGTELIRSNRIYIYDLSDNSLICTHLYVSTESIHELPPNTDGSIVYESGKSSADFVNGAQYYAQIQTYTDTNGTQGGSGLSVAKMFWCLGDPTLTITTIPSTISTTSYNISATYTDTSASVVSNIIQQYQFNLYSATGSLLQSSGVVVGSGTQQGTSDVYDISYNFTGLNVGSSYYVTVNVTTTQGMSVNAQSNTFTVSIDTPTLGEATVVNNACDGYISVTSNLSGEYGGSGSGEIVSFETDSEDIFTKLQVDLEPIQEGSGNPSPSNVRPIRGHSGVDVNVVGRNLFDPVDKESSNTKLEVIGNSVRLTAKTNSVGTGSYFTVPTRIPIIAGETIFVSVGEIIKSKKTLNATVYVGVNDENGNRIGNFDGNKAYQLPTNAKSIDVYLYADAGSGTAKTGDYIEYRNVQVEYGSTATPYEPYQQPQTITQDFNVSLTPTSTDTTPYLFKAVGDVYGDRLEDKIVGGTVAWNQMVREITSTYWMATGQIAEANFNNGVFSCIAQSQSSGIIDISSYRGRYHTNHVYLKSAKIWVESGTGTFQFRIASGYGDLACNVTTTPTVFSSVTKTPSDGNLDISITDKRTEGFTRMYVEDIQVFDLTQMFGSTIADYIYSLEQSQAGAGVAWFKKLFPNDYYAYNAGELLSVEGLQSHDTVGFNQWDEEWESGGVNATNGTEYASSVRIRSDFIEVLPNTKYYFRSDSTSTAYFWAVIAYDSDKKYISDIGYNNNYEATTPNGCKYIRLCLNEASLTHDICINLSNPSRNGEYEPYKKHSYPLDSSLTLRGIPKLDASNNLYYDGDEYTSDGKVKRKYGVVDLGTLSWFKDGNAYSFGKQTWLPDRDNFGAIINGYTFVKEGTDATNLDKIYKTIRYTEGYGAIYVKDSSYATTDAFKAAMSGVMLVYELATPTTETATPYTNPQIVSKYGTLEYVTNSIVPVGHKTTYLTRDIFGGYVDLISGKLVVDKAMVVFDGTQSDLGVSVLSGFTQVSWAGYVSIGITSAEFVSDTFEFDGTTAGVGKIYPSPNAPRMFFGMPTSITNQNEAQEWFRQHPTSVVYPLATPQTYQLTPQQVNTLVGTNNVWSEQGNIELSYHIPITNLLVKRQDVDDVSGGWLTLYSQPITQASDMDFTFIDFLNQYGKTYKYALVPLLTQTQSGVEVEVEGGYTVSNEVQSVFDGVFIADSTGSQKCKANVGYGNVDMNQVVGSITPIGAKYPIIVTNSHNQYHNGSISGTIVPDDYYFNGNLSRIDMVKKRNELEQFLTNKRVKVIKDWNGNIWLVMIAGNVSCTFNNNYGMGIVNFSTNWTEVGDPTNQQDLQATGLINVGGV